MPVDSVKSSNSNVGLYAAGAAVVGGGAGAAAGWYSRPFLKKGEPTDEYINTTGKKILKSLPEEFSTGLKSAVDKFNKAKSTEDLRTMMTDLIKNAYKNADFDTAKASLENTNDILTSFGLNSFNAEEIANVKNKDDIAELYGKIFDKIFEGKSLEQVKTTIKGRVLESKNSAIKGVFTLLWDPDKKKFSQGMSQFDDYKEFLGNMNPQIKEFMENAANTSEKITKVFSGVANTIKGKYAAIYGAIGAAVLGLGTLLCLGGKKAEQVVPESVDEDLQDTEELAEKE